MTDSISKAAFNDAVQSAITAVKPLLLAAEAEANDLDLGAGHPLNAALSALHAELSEQLSIADGLGSTGMHTDGGGSGKGDAD